MKLTVDQYVSIRVTTPGYTDRYLRHQEGLGFTEVVNSDSDDLRNHPRPYLRHIDAELWLAQSGGTHAWNNPASFVPDTT